MYIYVVQGIREARSDSKMIPSPIPMFLKSAEDLRMALAAMCYFPGLGVVV